MNKRTVKVTITFDMSEFPEHWVTDADVVKELTSTFVEACSDVEGYSGVKVEVIDE